MSAGNDVTACDVIRRAGSAFPTLVKSTDMPETRGKLPPYGAVPSCVILDARLGKNDLRVLCYLHARRNRANGTCNPEYKTIAGDLGIAERKVRDVLPRLRSFGYIDWPVSRSGRKVNGSNFILLELISEGKATVAEQAQNEPIEQAQNGPMGIREQAQNGPIEQAQNGAVNREANNKAAAKLIEFPGASLGKLDHLADARTIARQVVSIYPKTNGGLGEPWRKPPTSEVVALLEAGECGDDIVEAVEAFAEQFEIGKHDLPSPGEFLSVRGPWEAYSSAKDAERHQAELDAMTPQERAVYQRVLADMAEAERLGVPYEVYKQRKQREPGKGALTPKFKERAHA